MERFDFTERKLIRRLLGYFWPRVCRNEELYAEVDMVYRRMTHRRYQHQHLGSQSKVATENRLRFFGHILESPADRLVQGVLRSLPGSSWKKPPGRKRKFWTKMAKEDLRTLGVDRQFRRDVRFRKVWNNGSIPYKLSQKIEKVGQSCVQARDTSARMRVVATFPRFCGTTPVHPSSSEKVENILKITLVPLCNLVRSVPETCSHRSQRILILFTTDVWRSLVKFTIPPQFIKFPMEIFTG
ncbi:hypothetical protein RB195_008366 [Necator americanus]|uniref:Uncharacterized protein n=1 Tax=Necator americanus TaxID=51031 RepID=A0ABR1CPS6_NECAM